MKFGVIIFPGSNCDEDMIYALRGNMGQSVESIWHKEDNIDQFSTEDWLVLPGGFSYGDYLRAGAIAQFSPIMKEVIRFAEEGGQVLGICNGFQVLCEAGLLPGALLPNVQQTFSCKNIYIKPEQTNSSLTRQVPSETPLTIPIAHSEGCYYAQKETLQQMYDNNQILYRYCNKEGEVEESANPNGSLDNIAGICNKGGNVYGMMPHPERAADPVLGNTDGRPIFESMINTHQKAEIS